MLLVAINCSIFFVFQFKAGRWYATEKFDTASKCLTYEFKDDPNGEYLVEQTSVLTGLRRLSVDNKVKYRGKLVAPYTSEPANMIARFPLSKYLNRYLFFLAKLATLRKYVQYSFDARFEVLFLFCISLSLEKPLFVHFVHTAADAFIIN